MSGEYAGTDRPSARVSSPLDTPPDHARATDSAELVHPRSPSILPGLPQNEKKTPFGVFFSFCVRPGRIELPSDPWQGSVLPLNYGRFCFLWPGHLTIFAHYRLSINCLGSILSHSCIFSFKYTLLTVSTQIPYRSFRASCLPGTTLLLVKVTPAPRANAQNRRFDCSSWPG